MAAIARKDDEDRRHRQVQGTAKTKAKARAKGMYQGRPKDTEKRLSIREMLDAGLPVQKVASHAGRSTSTRQAAKAEDK